MIRVFERVVALVAMISFSSCAEASTVLWNRAFVLYEGFDLTGTYERYTMGSPYLNMVATRDGTALELWAMPEANLVSANTFIQIYYILGSDFFVSPDYVYGSSSYFAYAAYKGALDTYEEYADYSIRIDKGESVYLAFAVQPSDAIESSTCGWVELGLDGGGNLTALHSAWDLDGDPIKVGVIPEPSSALLLLLGGAVLGLRRRIRREGCWFADD